MAGRAAFCGDQPHSSRSGWSCQGLCLLHQLFPLLQCLYVCSSLACNGQQGLIVDALDGVLGENGTDHFWKDIYEVRTLDPNLLAKVGIMLQLALTLLPSRSW